MEPHRKGLPPADGMRAELRPLLLFDLDGTLLDAAGAGRAALHNASRQLFGDALDFNRVATAGRLDGAIFREAAEHAGWLDHDDQHALLREAYPAELERELAERGGRVRLLPGVAALLAALQALTVGDALGGPVVGCLTGNMRAAARVKLRAVGLDEEVFEVAVYGDEARTRDGLVEVALQRYERRVGQPAGRDRVAVIGDTPFDIACAKAHGCRAVAVATGGYDVEALAAAGADVVLADLRDTASVMAMLLGNPKG